MKEKFKHSERKKIEEEEEEEEPKQTNKQTKENKGINNNEICGGGGPHEEERSLGSITNHQSTLIIIGESVDSDHQGPTKRRRCPRLPPQLSRTAHLPPPPLYNQSSAPRRESRTFLYTSSRKENQCQKFSIERRTRSRPVFPMPPVECKRT